MKIMTALDHSEYSEIVLEHGLDQAAQHPDAELHFLTVVADDDDAAAARVWLDTVVREGLDAFGISDRRAILHVLPGLPAPTIAAVSRDLSSADLLVLGRFHVPSASDVVIDMVHCPTLVVGIEGHVLEPQCSACEAVRHESEGDQLFCEAHSGDRLPDLVGRVPPSATFASRLW